VDRRPARRLDDAPNGRRSSGVISVTALVRHRVAFAFEDGSAHRRVLSAIGAAVATSRRIAKLLALQPALSRAFDRRRASH